LRGYTTYPRTESTDFSPNFDFIEIIKEHTAHPEWGKFAQNLLKNGHNRPKKGHDAGDHPPITPVRAANRGELLDHEWKVYSFIARSFLGCVSSDATYDSVAVVFDAAGEVFKLAGRILLHAGFLEIMTWHNGADIDVPDFKVNEVV
jgi:DNA topoisomerase-3